MAEQLTLTDSELLELQAAAAIDDWWVRRCAGTHPTVPDDVDQLAIRSLVRRGLLEHGPGDRLVTAEGRRVLAAITIPPTARASAEHRAADSTVPSGAVAASPPGTIPPSPGGEALISERVAS